MVGPCGPMESVSMGGSWTTTNMDYGNFYRQDGNRKVQSMTSQAGEGDIHAECKRQLEAIRKELEKCQAQVRLQQNTIVNMSSSRPTCTDAADRNINERRITGGGEAQQHNNNNNNNKVVEDAAEIKSRRIKSTAKPATPADHSTSRIKRDRLRTTKVGGHRNNVGDAVLMKPHNVHVLPATSSSPIRQTCSVPFPSS
ncbi:hypothetical protein GOP47_0027146 [Adiantum capillus-veneris]|nr:hypothetical protein GOP47_0027146 [Adiantum capillus-veneris]